MGPWAVRVEEKKSKDDAWWSHVWDKVPTAELMRRLGTVRVLEVLRRDRLRRFGHVERKATDDWASGCGNIEVARGGRGRQRKTCGQRLNEDMTAFMTSLMAM